MTTNPIKQPQTTFILLPLFAALTSMLVACDDADEDWQDASQQVELPEHIGQDLVITTDGVERPELILARVDAPDGTKLYFVESEGPDAEPSVDVIIVGFDGGFDYGGLLGPDKATPLELFLASSEPDVEPPDELVVAHNRQIEQTGRSASVELQIPDAPGPLEHHGPSGSHDQTYGDSTFTCLSWSNFQTFMDSIHSGFAGRVQAVSAPTSGFNALYLPDAYNWYAGGSADLVVCNYKSDDPSVEDQIWAHACHDYNPSNPASNCGTQILYDGQYLRRVYGAQAYHRRYRVDSTPLNGETLQSFLGIVRSNS